MGSLFRSQEMTLCQLYLQSESTYSCLSELGELGLVQFRDLNSHVSSFQRKFVNEIRRCDEMERKLDYLESEVKKHEIQPLNCDQIPIAPQPKEMIDLEATFESLENELKEANLNTQKLQQNSLELIELKYILKKMQEFFEESATHHEPIINEQMNIIAENVVQNQQTLAFSSITGVINRERFAAFERMIWRTCHGKCYMKHEDIEVALEDPLTGNLMNKIAFVVFFQGDQLKTKIRKICDGFRATIYQCPETIADRREMIQSLMIRLEDLKLVLQRTKDHRLRILINVSKNIKSWSIKVIKIKAIFTTMNMLNFDVTEKCLIAECWCAVTDIELIQAALYRAMENCQSTVPNILHRMATKKTPPTYQATNKFTNSFQGIIDAYGVANYQEVNPTQFTIITFPFLFAVMFGDAGHGIIMMCFALWMIFYERRLIAKKAHKDEMFGMFFGGRYIILLMGVFSIYTGFVYNDFFSKSINIFGSGWVANSYKTNFTDKLFMLNPNTNITNDWTKTPYAYGMDPIWQMSNNRITFLNSYKKKMSVILGVVQMFIGVCLSLSNNIYKRNYINIFCEFIPQMIFFCSIFLYLIILIIAKWVYSTALDSSCSPSLLIGLINMVMFSYQKLNDDKSNCAVVEWFTGQKILQSVLVVLAVICIPWHLILKPLILWIQYIRKRNKNQLIRSRVVNIDVVDDQLPLVHSVRMDNGAEIMEEDEKLEMGDIIVHQAIHTIEYCLNCISHTASYLRLWALSLAHSQLSEVLWQMVLRFGLKSPGYFGGPLIAILFCPFAILTVGILLIMEGLSAFLHALRLHWVEFQSKFYAGAGYQFEPFSFKTILDLDMEYNDLSNSLNISD